MCFVVFYICFNFLKMCFVVFYSMSLISLRPNRCCTQGFIYIVSVAFLQVDLYLLPQAAFPTGGLYFKNQTWVQETKGMQVIIHNNYITGFEKKIKRFQDYGLWLVDDHASESPLGRL